MTSNSLARRMGLLTLLLSAGFPALGLDNGVARTPPMGFNPYNAAGLHQMNDAPWRGVARAMSMNGMKDAGYVYVNNDCNMIRPFSRNPDGTPVLRGGLGDLAGTCNYIHGLGLKVGFYIYPVDLNHHDKPEYIAKDVTYFNSFGFDYLKYDGWMATPQSAFEGMRDALAATGRPIVYSVNGASGGNLCNMARCSPDIGNWWESTIGCLGCAAGGLGKPGYWPDPDIMETGNLASVDEDMSAFSLWCVTSSPLLSGNDPRVMDNSTHYILLNTEAIAVNQDTAFSVNPSYGGSGKYLKGYGDVHIWCKTVTGGAKAVVLVNLGGSRASGKVTWADIGLPAGTAQVRDLWEHKNLGSFADQYSVDLPSHGCAFVKVVAGTGPIPEPPATWYPKPAADIPFTELPKSGWTATSNLAGPSQYLDGSVTTPGDGQSGCGSQNWIQVDMKTPQTINVVTLAGYNSRAKNSVKRYTAWAPEHTMKLSVSSDGSTWTPVCSTAIGPFSYTLFTFETQTARYFRIDHSKSPDAGRTYGFCVYEESGGISEIYVGNIDNLAVETSRQEVAVCGASGVKRQAPMRVLLLNDAAIVRRGWSAQWYTIQGRALGTNGRQSQIAQQCGIRILREAR